MYIYHYVCAQYTYRNSTNTTFSPHPSVTVVCTPILRTHDLLSGPHAGYIYCHTCTYKTNHYATKFNFSPMICSDLHTWCLLYIWQIFCLFVLFYLYGLYDFRTPGQGT